MKDTTNNGNDDSSCNDTANKTISNNNGTRDGKRWIVAMTDGSMFVSINGKNSYECLGKTIGNIVRCKDPSTGETRDYALVKKESICAQRSIISIVEFQDLPSHLSAFMVGRHIIKDGSLYLLNRVDPLFFYLAAQEHHLREQQQSNKSWQPFEQCLEESNNKVLPREIHPAITKDQLQHLCLTFENDDVCYLRFDVNKALNWLQRKQKRLLECLIRQDQQEQMRKAKLYESSFYQEGDGSFYVPTLESVTTPSKHDVKSDKDSKSSSPAVLISDTEALKLQSIQIVCNYLTEAWSEKFVHHLGCSVEVVRNNGNSKTSLKIQAGDDSNIQSLVESVENAETTAKVAAKAVADKKARESYRTAGNKRLTKVSTKGMKSIASFFGAAPPSKKAKH